LERGLLRPRTSVRGLEDESSIAVVSNALLALIIFGGDLPDGAKLSVRFDPARAKPGSKATLEISVTPPPGSVLLALAQPKSLGAPTAVDLDLGPFKPAGKLEEPAVGERLERALESQRVRYYPRSFGGTVVFRLPLTAPTSFDDGRAEIRGSVTLMFVDESTGKLTLAPSVAIAASLEEDKPAPATPPVIESASSVVIEAPPKQRIETPAPANAGPPIEIIAPPETDPLPPFKRHWFLVGVAAGLFALGAGPIGVYDERKWWARWLGWRRLQCLTTVVSSATLLAVAFFLPTRTAIPVLGGSAAFGAMLFATGGGPGVTSSNFIVTAVRSQPVHCLMLCLALLLNAACWDLWAGFAAVFLARSFAPAIMPIGDEEFDEDDDDFEDTPRRKRSKSRRRAA